VNGKRTRRVGLVAIVALLCAAAAAYAAGGTFVEQDIRVLHQFDGTGSASFGWAVSPVGDPRHKRLNNVLVSEAFNGPGFDKGSAYLYSSRTGRLLRQWDGQDGDWFSFAVADAGDTNGDGATDILLGAPGPTAAGGPDTSTSSRARPASCSIASSANGRGMPSDGRRRAPETSTATGTRTFWWARRRSTTRPLPAARTSTRGGRTS
jgi:hypothetical protein